MDSLRFEHPVHLFKSVRHLTPRLFEAALSPSPLGRTEVDSWRHQVSTGLLLDLSHIEWVDIGALVQLVLFANKACQARVDVAIALPLGATTSRERHRLASGTIDRAFVEKTQKARTAALKFLNYMQFRHVLAFPNLPPSQHPQILQGFDPTQDPRKIAQSTDDESTASSASSDPLYRYSFPLKWLSHERAPEEIDAMARFLAGVLGEHQRGVHPLDAQTLANVVLFELLDNVKRHADTQGWALIAAWARPATKPPDRATGTEVEYPYLDWVAQTNSPVADIVVGDAGLGLARVLRSAIPEDQSLKSDELLLWAFDRWSTTDTLSGPRGTRGLYRVHRVVKKYQGLITIRSGDALAGWDHGGSGHNASFRKRDLVRLPGTTVRLRMPSREALQTAVRPTSQPIQDPRVTLIRLGPLSSTGLSAAALAELRTMSDTHQGRPTCIAGIVDGGIATHEAVLAGLRQSAEIRHPTALALFGLPGGWDLVDNAVDALNEEFEQFGRGSEHLSPEHTEIWDPVLVVGDGGETSWAGVAGAARFLLDALVNHDGVLPLDLCDKYCGTRENTLQLLRNLRHDEQLVQLSPDSVALTFSVGSIYLAVSAVLKSHIDAEKPGVHVGTLYRTPSLLLTKKWLDIPTVLESSVTASVSLLALADKVKSTVAWLADDDVSIVSDSREQRAHIEVLGRALQLKHELVPTDASPGAAPDPTVSREGAKVLLYSDIIATGESIARHLSAICRDGGRPIAVVTLFDARQRKDPTIVAWDHQIPVVGLVPVDVHVPDAAMELGIVNISPITKQAEDTVTAKPTGNHSLTEAGIEYLIDSAAALHFTHVGSRVGRHFTFYLDAAPLVASESVFRAFDEEITRWTRRAGKNPPRSPADKLEIWFPAPEARRFEPARRLAERLLETRDDVAGIYPLQRLPAHGKWAFPPLL